MIYPHIHSFATSFILHLHFPSSPPPELIPVLVEKGLDVDISGATLLVLVSLHLHLIIIIPVRPSRPHASVCVSSSQARDFPG